MAVRVCMVGIQKDDGCMVMWERGAADLERRAPGPAILASLSSLAPARVHRPGPNLRAMLVSCVMLGQSFHFIASASSSMQFIVKIHVYLAVVF